MDKFLIRTKRPNISIQYDTRTSTPDPVQTVHQETSATISQSASISNVTDFSFEQQNDPQSVQKLNRLEATEGNQIKITDELGTKESGPYQPKLDSYPLTEFGTQKRGFNQKWFNLFPFIEYSINTNRVYCFECRHFCILEGNSEDLFVTTGFLIGNMVKNDY